ncbi:hypothetical protein BH11PSE11_BH11PSE11_05370 [soil metagenome]
MNKQERLEKDYSRMDVRSAHIVEKALELQALVGTRYAAVVLHSEKIRSAVMLRVLLRPEERRKFDRNTAS